ncbi:MAG: nicotinate-nucleotide adenylyltransferase [Gammaproteobacteria bacterium]|nr:nicotinate-nucleotide adenylyltransferase [Gammaproteobacteria bacterium]
MIGILGGTFDPVHYGHLRLAEEMREALGLTQVRFIPAFQPPHREPPVASAHQRLAMLYLALQDNKAFTVDTREYERGGPSWMVDTCASLRASYSDRPLVLIMGMDAFNGFTRWRDWQGILARVHLAVATRPGATLTAEAAQLLAEYASSAAELKQAPAGRIVEVPIAALDISATRLRELAAQNHSTRYLLPEAVREYLLRNRLYRTNL